MFLSLLKFVSTYLIVQLCNTYVLNEFDKKFTMFFLKTVKDKEKACIIKIIGRSRLFKDDFNWLKGQRHFNISLI